VRKVHHTGCGEGSTGFVLKNDLLWLREAEWNDNEEKFDNREFG
jgi:hypothetical protein